MPLQGFQEGDERSLVVRRKFQAVLVARHRAMFHLVAFEAFRNIVVAQAGRVEPFFETAAPMHHATNGSIPQAPQRWDFVESRAFAGFQCGGGFGSDGKQQHVRAVRMVLGGVHPFASVSLLFV